MFGIIRRYLKGRARIIAKAQMKNSLKKLRTNRTGLYAVCRAN